MTNKTFTAIAGQNGAGKTHYMTELSIKEFPDFLKRYPEARFFSNIQIFNTDFDEKIKKFETIEEIKYITDAFVVIDELQDDVDNRDFMSNPKGIIKFFEQHRHSNLRIYCTTQVFRKIDIKLRELIQRAYHIVKIYGVEKKYCIYRIYNLSIPYIATTTDIQKIPTIGLIPKFGFASPWKIEHYNTWEDHALLPFKLCLSIKKKKKTLKIKKIQD